ncbi:hypothetical protein K2Z84_23475 [Candidatus Binatia bacterium]|jgi:hypothetical protein|nr:hypothetical protein [Candidatus Binatia bacterium]
MPSLVRLSRIVRNVAPRSWRRAHAPGETPCRAALALLVMLAALPACGNRSASATGDIECVRIDVVDLALTEDPACTVASDAVASRYLPDLSFTPGLCYQTAVVPITLTAADGRSFGLRIQAFSGIDNNPVSGAALAPLPAPPNIVFTAASVIRVQTGAGEAVGQLVMRDTGWAEIGAGSTLPRFVSERLVVVGTSGELLRGAVGEVIATGDEFTGIPARGSLCAAGLVERLVPYAS